jgi:hypothetical protein
MGWLGTSFRGCGDACGHAVRDALGGRRRREASRVDGIYFNAPRRQRRVPALALRGELDRRLEQLLVVDVGTDRRHVEVDVDVLGHSRKGGCERLDADLAQQHAALGQAVREIVAVAGNLNVQRVGRRGRQRDHPVGSLRETVDGQLRVVVVGHTDSACEPLRMVGARRALIV